jgi:uncharacterized phage protein gp47/JayE
MAFENKTIEDIYALLINSFQSKFNKTFRLLSKSFIAVISKISAAVFITLYKQIGWLFLQLWPETAYWDAVSVLGVKIRPLVKWGVLIGVGEPKAGSAWSGAVRVSVTATGGILPAGTQLKSDASGRLYITEAAVPLDHETEIAPVTCAETGTAGNLDAGNVLSFAAPLGSVQKTAAVIETLKYAADDETEQDYRARVVNRFRSPPLGGALADYRKWGLDVEGVYNIYPYKDTETAAGVFIHVAGSPEVFPDRIPSPELLVKVGDACTYDPETGKQNRKPLCAVLDPDFDGTYENIMPVTVVPFDIYVTGVAGVPVPDFAEAVRPMLENYFLGREPYIRGLSDDNNKINIVSKNNAASIVNQAAVAVKAEFEAVLMCLDDEVCPKYTLGRGELAKLNSLTINGVPV